jgi:hypothetical protein
MYYAWSDGRDSNPRPSPWQGDVLPLNYRRTALCITRLYYNDSDMLGMLKTKIDTRHIAILLVLIPLSLFLLENSSSSCKLENKEKFDQSKACEDLDLEYEFESYYRNSHGTFENMIIDVAVSERVFQVDREDIGGNNGIACRSIIIETIDDNKIFDATGSFGYIARDLPHFSSKYVAIHEAYHLLGERSEMAANYSAGLKEPIGLVQTIFYSVLHGLRKTPAENYPCLVGSSWEIFKVYFLGYSQ